MKLTSQGSTVEIGRAIFIFISDFGVEGATGCKILLPRLLLQNLLLLNS